MSLLLSHNSALERLRSVPPQADQSIVTATPIVLADAVPDRLEISRLRPVQLGLRQEPIHLLVPSSHIASKSVKVVEHGTRLEEVPTGLLRIVSPGVYASGAELTFIQMACSISELGAVVLGHELCGRYSHFSQMASGFYDRPALTDRNRIEDALDDLEGMHGLSAARQALRWVRDGSASPMETVVSCMLNLPSRMGGFGFVAPTLNYEVELNAAARRITGKRVAYVDTGYPEPKVGLEFDGEEYHRDEAKDRLRREALAHMGWKIYVLNVDEATDYRVLRDRVSLLGDVPRQRGTKEVSFQEGRKLLDRLLRATRFGLGLNAAFFGVDVPRGKVKLHL